MAWYETISLCIGIMALLISLGSLCYVKIQVDAFIRQQKIDVHSRIIEINRNLMGMGFEHPDLLKVVDGQRIENPLRQKKFIQLWINQFELMWRARKARMIDDAYWDALQQDIMFFYKLDFVAEHWKTAKHYYAIDYAGFIDQIIAEIVYDKNQTNKEGDVFQSNKKSCYRNSL